jgi:hypothetical protein
LAELDDDDCEDEDAADGTYSVETSDRLAVGVALVLAARALGWDEASLVFVADDVATRLPGVTGRVGLPIARAALARRPLRLPRVLDVALCAVAWPSEDPSAMTAAGEPESPWPLCAATMLWR